MNVNRYDSTASMLVSLLVMAGTVFLALLVVFISRALNPVITSKPVELFEPGNPGGGPQGFAEEPDPPSLEDAPDLTEPQLEDTLTAISSTLADQLTEIEPMLDATKKSQGDARNTGPGTGGGPGGTGSGPGSPDCAKEMKFEPTSLDDYEKLLDNYGAELAVLDPSTNKVYYASNLSAAKPTTRVGEPPDNRFNFRSLGEPLRSMEIQIARNAGIMKNGASIVVFYPEKTKNEIYGLERERMTANGIKERTQVRLTVFRFTRVGTAYDFKIEDQTYF